MFLGAGVTGLEISHAVPRSSVNNFSVRSKFPSGKTRQGSVREGNQVIKGPRNIVIEEGTRVPGEPPHSYLEPRSVAPLGAALRRSSLPFFARLGAMARRSTRRVSLRLIKPLLIERVKTPGNRSPKHESLPNRYTTLR